MDNNPLPLSVFSGKWPYGHCQGVAVDQKKQVVYFSFTTALIKTDYAGHVLGTVTGLLGHLGCIALCEADGRVYGSLEYKSDVIGRNILAHAGSTAQLSTAFYIAIFDGDRIDRVGMDACADQVMTTVYLREVYDDFTAVEDGRQHRYGCSGIDGVTFGRMPGGRDETVYLFVAYGIYGDVARADNDHQVLLAYDTSSWGQYERPLLQERMHTLGPDRPSDKLFVMTGNTTYGVQNLEYDPDTGHFFMAVYRGKKPCWPNYDLYIVDGSRPPQDHRLSLLDNGSGEKTPGWHFPYGATGLCALGGGLFSLSEDGQEDGLFFTNLTLYRFDGKTPFVRVKA